MGTDAPFLSSLFAYDSRDPVRLHMPGHKGRAPALSFLGDGLSLDVTELSATGNLYAGEGALRRAEELAAEAFGAADCVFCAGGATLAIQAMLAASTKPGDIIAADRRCHGSVLRTMVLLDLTPRWLWPTDDFILSTPSPEDAKQAVRDGAAAVMLTSPTYYGRLAPIEDFADTGVPLLIDNAHGSHLAFHEEGRLHPIRRGADLCCDSAHKTLPALTGGAYLLSRRRDSERLREAMALFGSTSPSFPILASLDACRAYMQSQGEESLYRLLDGIETAADFIHRNSGAKVLRGKDFDPFRLVVETSADGRDAAELLEQAGIFVEMADSRHVVALPSVETRPEELARFAKALCSALAGLAPAREQSPDAPPRLEAAMTPRQAWFSDTVVLPIKEAAGRIAARPLVPYPPGVPSVMPGERLTREAAELLSTQFDPITVVA